MSGAVLVLSAGMPARLQAQLPASLPPTVGGEISPPAAIVGLDARPAPPLEFSRGWLGKTEGVRQRRAELLAADLLHGVAPAQLAALGAALSGTLRVPVIPVHYADIAPPFEARVLSERLFGATRGDTLSYSDYWAESSGGLLRVEGQVAPWVRLSKEARHYLPRDQFGWARFGRMAELRREALLAADAHLDFGQFDNDGPDGIPNSGDDDGHVDFVALVYATRCRGDTRSGAIWPHRGAMAPLETSDRAANGGVIKIADYVILSAIEPGTCAPLHIGVLAHETAHAFGLPDLYDYDGSSQGIGAWDLMATGSHSTSFSPAHLSAWGMEQLGWVRVDWLRAHTTSLSIPPVRSARIVHRYDLPGTSGQYVLLENRQRIGSDARLPGSGLLVWRVDPDRGELGGWNTEESREAVALLPADGRGKLARGHVADAGDPYPGKTRRHELALATSRGRLRLAEISESDAAITTNVHIEAVAPLLVAAPAEARLAAVAGGPAVTQLITLRAPRGHSPMWRARAAADWLHIDQLGHALFVRAEPALMPPGTYSDTLELVLADSDSVIGQVPVELSVAAAGEPETIATGLGWSWGIASYDGRLVQASYSWDPLNLRPRPRLLESRPGERVPQTLARLPAEALYAPVAADSGAVYVLARARDKNYLYRVEADGAATIVTAQLGSAPSYGVTTLGDGSILVADFNGHIQKITRAGEIEPWRSLDERVYQIAADRWGTVYAAGYSGNVLRLEPSGQRTALPTGFGRGRLVSVAVARDGAVFAAERGGEGRIVRIGRDGIRREITRILGAHFYGLAVDEQFLYAADLRNRQLLRIPLPAEKLALAP